MLKRILAGSLAAVLIAAPALAEVYIGSTVARDCVPIISTASAAIDELQLQAGMSVTEGSTAARLRTTKVFASQDGAIARIEGGDGLEIDGTVLELQPVSRYDIYCTIDEGYDTAANNLVHSGEEIYMKCTYNGTHQGSARITSIDGETFMAEATGGEFYNGETVYIYRDPEYDYSKLIGVGTVLAASTEIYEDSGRIVQMHVQEGEYVQRGELLYEIIDGEGVQVEVPADGIISECAASEGDMVQEGGAIATLVPWDEICIAIEVEEDAAAQISIGDEAAMTYACDNEETLVPGVVTEISNLGQDGLYTVYIRPETMPDRLGMTVNVRIGA